jgi:hypothetical protein
MSQAGRFVTAGSLGAVETLTGNSGGAVGPTAGNINVVGTGSITVTDNPGTSTLTISSSAVSGIITLDGNSGSATGSTVIVTTSILNANGTSKFSGSSNVLELNYEDANENVGFGDGSLSDGGAGSPSGSGNTALGHASGFAITSGSENVAIGDEAASSITTGSHNIGVGTSALGQTGGSGGVTTGSFNIGIGEDALVFTGGASSYNIVLGYQSGINLIGGTNSSNIYFNNSSTGSIGESNVLRIGSGTGTGNQQLANSYISGINGVNVGSVASVVAISGDHLGSTTITAGSNVTVTAAANTITIAASGMAAFAWNDVPGNSQTMVANNGYVADNAGLCTMTLPATAAFGTVIYVVGNGAGGWKIAQNAGQNIRLGSAGSTTVGVGGSLASTNQYDSIQLLCVVANTTWNAISIDGNVTIV